MLGWPGVSVPAGFTEAGLPIGVQLLGPANSEPRLLSLAAQLEAEERWHERWPQASEDFTGNTVNRETASAKKGTEARR